MWRGSDASRAGPESFRKEPRGVVMDVAWDGFVERVCEARRVRCWDVITRRVSVCSPWVAKIHPRTPKEAQKSHSSWERNCLDFASPGWDSGRWRLGCTQRAPFSRRTLSSQERRQEPAGEQPPLATKLSQTADLRIQACVLCKLKPVWVAE